MKHREECAEEVQLWNEDNHHWAPRPKDEAIREIFKRDKMGRVGYREPGEKRCSMNLNAGD